MRCSPTTGSSPGEAAPRADGAGALPAAVVALLALAAFLTQFVFRAADDNRLTSWRWVFADADLAPMLAAVAAGILLAYGLSRVAVPPAAVAGALPVGAFLLGAVFWRVPEVIVDAGRYFTQAKHLAVYGAAHFLGGWGREVAAWTDLPLVPFLFGVALAAGGEARLAVQALTTLLFAGAVLLTHRLGAALWDEEVGLSGAALLLAMPYLLAQVPLMLVDVPTMFFVLLAAWSLARALARGGPAWMALAAGSVTLAALTKYSAWAWLTGLGVMVLVAARREPAALRRAGVIALGPVLVLGALLWLRHDLATGQLALLREYQLPGLGRWRESFASTLLFQVHPFVPALALVGAGTALWRRDWRFAILAWPWLLAAALQAERSRYLIPLLPMLALMAACGLREIARADLRRFAAAAMVIVSLAVAVLGYLPHLERTSAANLKAGGAYLDALDADTVEVVTLPQDGAGLDPAVAVPLLDLFTRKRIVHEPGPAAAAPPEGHGTSPLRFTWEVPSPAYYRARPGEAGSGAPVLVIAEHAAPPLPAALERRLAGYQAAQVFAQSDAWFRYQTVVTIYRPGRPDAEGRTWARWQR